MPIHVMLVEDSPVAREKVSGILRELDCRVTTAVDGLEGLKMAKEHAGSLDLIVLDIQMPKADGITLLRYLRKLPELKSTPIIMLTTQADKDTVSQALGFGANDFLRKDATIAHITQRLATHVEAARNHLDLAQSAPDEDEREEKMRRLLLGSRKLGEGKGPYVLCYISLREIQDIGKPHGDRQRDFFERLAKGIALINARYPRLQLGYRLESVAQDVIQHLNSEESIPWVLLPGHRQEGISIAHMAGFSRVTENRTIHIICESVAPLSESAKKSITRMGGHLIERSEFEGPSLMELIGKHLLPPEQVLSNGVKLREFVSQSGATPRNVEALTLHYTAVCKDGTLVVNTYESGEPAVASKGEGVLPESLWEALSGLGPGSRVLVEIPAAAAADPVSFQVDLINVS